MFTGTISIKFKARNVPYWVILEIDLWKSNGRKQKSAKNFPEKLGVTHL